MARPDRSLSLSHQHSYTLTGSNLTVHWPRFTEGLLMALNRI